MVDHFAALRDMMKSLRKTNLWPLCKTSAVTNFDPMSWGLVRLLLGFA